jgi:hypothetical protein
MLAILGMAAPCAEHKKRLSGGTDGSVVGTVTARNPASRPAPRWHLLEVRLAAQMRGNLRGRGHYE